MSFKTNVILGIFFAVFVVAAAGIFGLYRSYQSELAMSRSDEAVLSYVRKIAYVEKTFGLMIQEWKNTLLRGGKREEYEKHSKAFDAALVTIFNKLNEIEAETRPEHKELLEKFRTQLKGLEEKYKKARADFINPTKYEPASADKAVKGIDRGVLDSFTALTAEVDKALEKESAERLGDVRTTLWFSIFCAIAAGFLCIVTLSVYIANTIRKIDKVILSLNHSSEQVLGTSGEVSQSSGNLASASTEQAAALNETASAIQEISSMVGKSLDNANRAAESSRTSEQTAQQGKAAVDRMMNSMNEISMSNDEILEQMNRSNTQLSDIMRVINDIGDKTKVINDIVFQTKLLSFNASVEAARAGENGKGFAVVAEEVGNLAGMSGTAAKEISDMLAQSMQSVEQMVNETKSRVDHLAQNGRNKVEAGLQITKECSEYLNAIVERVSSVAQMAAEISTAGKEQSVGIQEITKSISQLEEVTQQNSEISGSTAASAEQLATEADSLKSLVRDLVLAIKGKNVADTSREVIPLNSGENVMKHLKKVAIFVAIIALRARAEGPCTVTVIEGSSCASIKVSAQCEGTARTAKIIHCDGSVFSAKVKYKDHTYGFEGKGSTWGGSVNWNPKEVTAVQIAPEQKTEKTPKKTRIPAQAPVEPVMVPTTAVPAPVAAASSPTPAAPVAKAEEFKPLYSFFGDVRQRAEFVHQEDPGTNKRPGYDHLRLRARVGAKVQPTEDVQLEFRLATSTGGQTTNQSYGDGTVGMRNYPFNLDRASAKWTAPIPATILVQNVFGLVGRTANPFNAAGTNDLIFDSDLNFDGSTIGFDHKFGDSLSAYARGGYYILQESKDSVTNSDVTIAGTQVGLNGSFGSFKSALIGSMFSFSNVKNHSAIVGTDGMGNSFAAGKYTYDYNLLSLGAELTYTSKIPLTAYYEIVKNNAVEVNKTAYIAGLKVNKIKNANDWAVTVDTREIEKDSVFGILADGDSFGGGADGRSLRLSVSYAISKSFNISVTEFWGKKSIASGETPLVRDKLHIDLNFGF